MFSSGTTGKRMQSHYGHSDSPNRGDIHAIAPFGKHVSWIRAVSAAFVVIGWAIGPAFALPTSPSLKPDIPYQSNTLDQPEFRALSLALDAADDGDWARVRAALARISDPAAAALLRWELASNFGSGLPMEQLLQAETEFADWPEHSEIVSHIESRITESTMTSDMRIAWLTDKGPRTGAGILALADSYHSMARLDDMNRTIREAWHTRLLPSDVQETIEQKYGSALRESDHWSRVDMLLWRGRLTDARDLLPKLSSDHRKLADARIALRTNQNSIDTYVQAVPASLANDPGLAHERARWRERRGRDQGQLEMLLAIDGTHAPEIARDTIWREKHSEVRRLIQEGNYQPAYLLTINHGMTDGEGFRDAEWTAGWLALTRLHKPEDAEQHFRRFGAGVETPISVARAQYWLGEALMAQNRRTEAETAYLAAAEYNYVFYGALAAEKVAAIRPEVLQIKLDATPAPSEAQRLAFEHRPFVRAAILLAESGRMRSFERFSNAIDDTLETATEHQMLFDIGKSYLHMRAAVRGAKAGLGRGIIAPEAVFPILELPRSTRNGAAEPAMVLALSRQESEFYPGAVSSANAHGLMQMVPRYARAEARRVGVTFRESWLTDDPTFNLRLGRGFLDELVDQFGGSYILAAAAYNAGPSRARQWIKDFGDPRGGEVDPVDWIENIPFAETRNYVQRVLENTQVYRARLATGPTKIRLSEDLRRGHP